MLAGMREYGDAFFARVEALPRAAQTGGDIVVYRVALIRPVKGDNGNLIDDFIGDGVRGHVDSFKLSPCGGCNIARASSAIAPAPAGLTSNGLMSSSIKRGPSMAASQPTRTMTSTSLSMSAR